jgi:hypothetical protein
MSSKTERKRSLSTAFEHPTTPAREAKTNKIGTPASNTKENDHQGQDVDMESPAKVCQPPGITPHQRQPATSLPLRGVPLQQLVEVLSSGMVFRPKITLGEDVEEGLEVEGQWEAAPFAIWEDVDVVAERLSLGGEGEE